jgi:hypothetical protein
MLCSAMFVSKNQLASVCFHLWKNRQSGLFKVSQFDVSQFKVAQFRESQFNFTKQKLVI